MENVRRFRSPRGSAGRGFLALLALLAVACAAGLIWSAIAGRSVGDGDRAGHANVRAPGLEFRTPHRSDAIARELRALESGDRPGAQAGGEEARARTQEYDARRDEHEARTASIAFTGKVTDLLASARARVGRAPGIGGRLLPPRSATDEDRAAFEAAAVDVEEIRQILEAGADQARRRLIAYAERSSASAHAAVIRARIQQRRGELDDRAADAEEILSRTRDRLRERAAPGSGRALAYWQALTGGDPATELGEVEALLADWGATMEQPILGAQLTYVQGGIGNGALPTVSVTPAYAASQVLAPALEDVTLGREVELSPEVKAKAQSLATAKAAYDFVKNELHIEWYAGCLKGSTETLRQGRGNDADAASLLIAILRAQGTPARYVQGVIELPVARLAELLGLLDAAQVDAMLADGDATLPAALRSQALSALTAAGIPFEPVTAGGQVSAVRLSHVWVEGYLPYADYRGTGGGAEGKQWIPMDPAIGGVPKYAAVPPLVDALSAMGTSAAALTDEYLEAGAGRSPLEFYRSKVEAFLESNRPGLTYEKVLRTIQSRVEETSFIPGSLPYQVVSVSGEYAFLPESSKHRVRVVAEDASGALLDVTLPAHQVLGHRSVFAYKPATDADVELVALAGGYFEAPAALVEVLPVVRVNGVERAVATRSVGLGAQHGIALELLLPDGSSRRIENRVIAGNVVALGIGGPKNGFQEPTADEADDSEGIAARFLYGRAAAYANAWTDAEEELARLTQVVPVRPTASVVLVEYQLEVEQALGQPQRLGWRGLQVDADLRTMTPLEIVAGRGKELQRLSGYEGSYLEAKVLSEGTGEESVSSVAVIQAAHGQGLPVLRIAPENAAVELSRLVASPEVQRDVADQVSRGREVLIPATPLALRDWNGTGYIATDRTTQEAGYFLSGRVSGGMTIVSPRWWTDAELLAALANTGAQRSTKDTSKVARIVVLPSTNYQSGVVGQQLAKALAVRVTTSDGIPVAGASVVFRRAGASEPRLLGATSSDGAATVATDVNGVALVKAEPDTNILRSFIEDGSEPFDQYVGLNEITAETSNGVATVIAADRIWFVGLPDAAALISSSPESPAHVRSEVELEYQLKVSVTDKYGNPIANAPVSWSEAVDDPAKQGQGGFVSADAEIGRSWTLRDCGVAVACSADAEMVTDSRGMARVGFVTPWGVGTATVVATVETLASVWKLDFAPTVPFMRLRAVADPTTGIAGTSWPGPVMVEVWGPQGIVTDVPVALRITGANGVTLEQTSVLPKDDPAGRTSPFDSPTLAVFWPRYAVPGPQTATFSATITSGTSGRYDLVRSFGVAAEPVVLQAFRLPSGDPATPARASDPGVELRVTNPASSGVLLSVTQSSQCGSERLLAEPSSAFPRDDYRPDLIVVGPTATHRMLLGMVPNTNGGRIDAEVFVREPDEATGAATLVSVASESIEVVPAVDAWANGFVDREALLRGTAALRVSYVAPIATSASCGVDRLVFRVYDDATNVLVHSQDVVAPFTGTVSWGGRLASGVFVPAGAYRGQLEAVSHGTSRATSLPFQFTVFEVVVLNPRDVNGNGAVDDPEEDASGTGNEFTFWSPVSRFQGASGRNAGRLRVDCSATIVPASLAAQIRWRVFNGADVSDATGVAFAPSGVDRRWDGADVGEGKGDKPRFTIDGMPARNDDFGRKTVRVRVLDPGDSASVLKEVSVPIEVFWPLLVTSPGSREDGNFAKSHPGLDMNATRAGDLVGKVLRDGERSPNWLYYWGQVVEARDGVPLEHLRYMDSLVSGVFGVTPAMLYYPNGYAGRHDRVLIGELAQDVDPDPDRGGPRQQTTGIDAFRDTVVHEHFHALNQTVLFTNMAFGTSVTGADVVTDARWSFNIQHPVILPRPPLSAGRLYNHFRDVNGDGDFLDSGEDLDVDGDSVPNQLDPAPTVPTDYIESSAWGAEPDTENALGGSDWGNPGKRHKNDNDYSD